jgi:hypothetical protein
MNQVTSILNQKLSISENALAQELNGEVVILNIESETYYSLNAVGSRIWLLLSSLENVKALIEQLLQVYVVDEVRFHADVTAFVEKLVEEGLLSRYSKIDKTNLQKADEIKKHNQPQEEDNRLPYEAPELRKHGKVNDTTLAIPVPGIRIDSRVGFRSIQS